MVSTTHGVRIVGTQHGPAMFWEKKFIPYPRMRDFHFEVSEFESLRCRNRIPYTRRDLIIRGPKAEWRFNVTDRETFSCWACQTSATHVPPQCCQAANGETLGTVTCINWIEGNGGSCSRTESSCVDRRQMPMKCR